MTCLLNCAKKAQGIIRKIPVLHIVLHTVHRVRLMTRSALLIGMS